MKRLRMNEKFLLDFDGRALELTLTSASITQSREDILSCELSCVVWGVDESEAEEYNKHKENEKMESIFTSDFTDSFEGRGCPCYCKKFNNEEDQMDLTQEYLHNSKNENDKIAIELGAIDENGRLLFPGKDLLLNILLQDKDIRAKFDKALSEIAEEE